MANFIVVNLQVARQSLFFFFSLLFPNSNYYLPTLLTYIELHYPKKKGRGTDYGVQ